MTVTIDTIGVGTVEEDGTGDTARDGGIKINSNFSNLKTAVETLQAVNALENIVEDTTPQLGGPLDVNGQEIQSSADVTLQLGDNAGTYSLAVQDSDSAEVASIDSNGKITADSVVFTQPLAVQRNVSDSELYLAGDTHPSTGAAFILYGGSHSTAASDLTFQAAGSTKLRWDHSLGMWDFIATDVNIGGDIIVDEKADHSSTPTAGKGLLWVRNDTPNSLIFTDDAGTDYDLTASSGGDFMADGSVDMTGQFRTDVGTFDSDVADGASANAYTFDTQNTYSTSGANLLRLSNNATPVFDFSYQGGIDHVNSGASTAAHSQSINLNWISNSSKTSSGQYSVVLGSYNTASSANAVAIGNGNVSSGNFAIAIGTSNTASTTASVALGGDNKATAGYGSVAIGYSASSVNRAEVAFGGGAFSSRGDAQSMIATLKVATTDATQTTLQAYLTDYVIPADTTWAFSALVVGRSDESDGNDSAAYRLEGCLSRDESNNTALVGSVTKTVIAESAGAAAWDVTAEAETTSYEGLAIKVTGEAATNIRWVAKVDISQVTYA